MAPAKIFSQIWYSTNFRLPIKENKKIMSQTMFSKDTYAYKYISVLKEQNSKLKEKHTDLLKIIEQQEKMLALFKKRTTLY